MDEIEIAIEEEEAEAARLLANLEGKAIDASTNAELVSLAAEFDTLKVKVSAMADKAATF